MAKILVQNGANIDDRGRECWTVLHHAVDRNEIDWVKFLLKNGASMNTKNLERFTPVEYGLKRNNLTNLKMMIMYQQSGQLNDCRTQIQTTHVRKNGYMKMLLAFLFVLMCMICIIALVFLIIEKLKKGK